jgi:hypothetical protein
MVPTQEYFLYLLLQLPALSLVIIFLFEKKSVSLIKMKKIIGFDPEKKNP